MREILFRGKRIDNGKWMEGYYAIIGKRKVIIALPGMYYDDNGKECYGNEIKDIVPETVSQYTGLNDENGMKIFEDDIVQCNGYTGIVKFGKNREKEYGYYIEWTSWNARYFRNDLIYWLNETENEVIGNVFDNPELLEEVDAE